MRRRELRNVERLRLEPGDILVYRIDRPLSADMAAHIKDALRARLGADIPVVVLDSGAHLEVVSRKRGMSTAAVYDLFDSIPPADKTRMEWVAPLSVLKEIAAELGLKSPTGPVCILGRPVVVDDNAPGLTWRMIEEEVVC